MVRQGRGLTRHCSRARIRAHAARIRQRAYPALVHVRRHRYSQSRKRDKGTSGARPKIAAVPRGRSSDRGIFERRSTKGSNKPGGPVALPPSKKRVTSALRKWSVLLPRPGAAFLPDGQSVSGYVRRAIRRILANCFSRKNILLVTAGMLAFRWMLEAVRISHKYII